MLYVTAVLKLLCYAVIVLIFVRAAFSWFSQNQRNPIYRYSFLLTEPLLAPVRRLLPAGNGLDFSPMIVSFGFFMLIGALNQVA